MAGNTNYAGLSAAAAELVVNRDWTNQVTQACAILACIKDRDLNWNKGFKISGTKAITPIIYTDASGVSTSNIGVSDANEVPSAWPTYVGTAGLTQAEFEFTHLRVPMSFKNSEKLLGQNKYRADLSQGKIQQMMATFSGNIAAMIEGESNNASRTKLLGINYAIASANVVGNIDQSTETWWQGVVQSAIGPLTTPIVDNAYDAIARYADGDGKTYAPDLFMLANPGGSAVNCYGRMRGLIAPAERVVNAEFMGKYGFANFQYLGMKCVQSARLAAGTADMLCTKAWYLGGDESPQLGPIQRIPGSDAMDWIWTQWMILMTNQIRVNAKLTGITG
jgi:hypothetical protein